MHVPKSSKLKLIKQQKQDQPTRSVRIRDCRGKYMEGGERGKLSTFVTLLSRLLVSVREGCTLAASFRSWSSVMSLIDSLCHLRTLLA